MTAKIDIDNQALKPQTQQTWKGSCGALGKGKGKDKGKGTGKKGEQPSGTTGDCNQWMQRGRCSREDCPFAHVQDKKGIKGPGTK